MSVSSATLAKHVVLNSLILGIENFLRVNNRAPWTVDFATRDETGVNRKEFQAHRITAVGGIFRAYGSIDGESAEILFFSEPGAASLLYMR